MLLLRSCWGFWRCSGVGATSKGIGIAAHLDSIKSHFDPDQLACYTARVGLNASPDLNLALERMILKWRPCLHSTSKVNFQPSCFASPNGPTAPWLISSWALRRLCPVGCSPPHVAWLHAVYVAWASWDTRPDCRWRWPPRIPSRRFSLCCSLVPCDLTLTTSLVRSWCDLQMWIVIFLVICSFWWENDGRDDPPWLPNYFFSK